MGNVLSHTEIASEPEVDSASSRSRSSSLAQCLTCDGRSRRGIDRGVSGGMGGSAFSTYEDDEGGGPFDSGSGPCLALSLVKLLILERLYRDGIR